MTPKRALNLGAEYIVMGRAILGQSDPVKAVEKIHGEISRV
jgi:orotidine-5'-phosphate decarboxylase